MSIKRRGQQLVHMLCCRVCCLHHVICCSQHALLPPACSASNPESGSFTMAGSNMANMLQGGGGSFVQQGETLGLPCVPCPLKYIHIKKLKGQQHRHCIQAGLASVS